MNGLAAPAAVAGAIAAGVGSIFNYGNIALTAVTLCLFLSIGLNFFAYRLIFNLAGPLNNFAAAAAALKERLDHHAETDDHKTG